MMRIMRRKTKTKTKTKVALIATAITTLVSATAALAAITTAKKAGTANGKDKSELEIVLDGLVEVGTITQAQEVAIHSAVTTAKEARTANENFTGGANGEFETAQDSTKAGTLTKFKKSLLKVVRSQSPKKTAEQMAI